MEGAELAKKTSDMCYKKWKNDKQPSHCDCIKYYFHGYRGCYKHSLKELGIELPVFSSDESNEDIAKWFDSLREFKHPYLNDSPLPLVLEEIMKTKPIEEIKKILEAVQIAENAAKIKSM
jgi:hypothetical protein